MTHYSIKEAAGFRKASDYVLKGIFNAYRKDPSFRAHFQLDDIPNILLTGGRNRAMFAAHRKGDYALVDKLLQNRPISSRSRRRAEFSQFKNMLNTRKVLTPDDPFMHSTTRSYLKGPITYGSIVGGWDPLVLRILALKKRAPQTWTQALGHELGHRIMGNMDKDLSRSFRRSVLSDYRKLFTPEQKKAVQKYLIQQRGFFPWSNEPLNFKKNAVTISSDNPYYDERVADTIGAQVGLGNDSMNRAIANHFNRYYRNVKGPVGWRVRHLLHAE